MAKNGNLKINLLFQTFYQILETCLPLITAPFLARVLGAEQLGIYSYTSSIVAYFALFAMLGTANYGTKCIASVNKDIYKRSKLFWEIYLLQFSICLIATFFYISYLLLWCTENNLIATIQLATLVGCIFNINWFFFGMEKFKITVTRNSIIRICTVAAILLFVKDSNDLWVYTIIMVTGTCISQLVLWFYLIKYIVFVKVCIKNILSHLKSNIVLFIPLLAMSVYHTMDKTMLGAISDYKQSGFYYNADKIVNIPVGIISGISTVLLPRMSSLIGKGDKDNADKLFCVSMEGTVWLGSAMAFGIAAIAKEFEPLFFGPGYETCILLTIVLAPVLIIKSFSFTARYQYLIPNNREKDFTVSVLIGAIFNLIFNIILIPKYGAMGAVLGTVIAELSACIWQYYVIRTYIDLSKVIRHCLGYFTIGLLMFILVRCAANFITISVLLKIILEIVIGTIFYCLFSFLYWNVTKSEVVIEMFGNVPIIKRIFVSFK